MDFITDGKIFEKKISEIESIIKREYEFPKQVFQEKFTKFLVIDFDEIFVDFFQRINVCLEALGETNWTFAVIDPNPEKYFYHHFKKYPILNVTKFDSHQDFQSRLWEDPGNSPADSLDSNAVKIVVYSKSQRWTIFADKDFEIGVVGFQDDETMEIFVSAYGKDRVFTMAEAITDLLEVMYKDHTVPEDIRKELLTNYG